MENNYDISGFKRHYWYQGILFITLGILAFILPVLFGLDFSAFIGIVFLAAGALELYHAFRARQAPGFTESVLLGAFFVIGGLLLLGYPIRGLATLTAIIAVLFLLEGIATTFLSFEMRPFPGWGWMLFTGILSFILAIMVWVGWPTSAFWFIALLIGVDLLFLGISDIVTAQKV